MTIPLKKQDGSLRSLVCRRVNRPIKFRAWHKSGEFKMLEVRELSWEKHKDGIIRGHFKAGLTDDESYLVSGYGNVDGSEDLGWVIMQFTGLHDRNEKEIYEGDIVRVTKLYLSESFDGEVVFNAFGWQVKTGTYCVVDFWNIVYQGEFKIEVVGNIYENPALAEQPKADPNDSEERRK